MSFKNSKFTQKNNSVSLYKGTFSITDLSKQKALLITNTKVLHSKAETDEVNFVEDGNIAFEITKNKSDTLIFRKYYTNQFGKTIAKGIFIKTHNLLVTATTTDLGNWLNEVDFVFEMIWQIRIKQTNN